MLLTYLLAVRAAVWSFWVSAAQCSLQLMQEHDWSAFAFEADVASLKQSSVHTSLSLPTINSLFATGSNLSPFIDHATVTLHLLASL